MKTLYRSARAVHTPGRSVFWAVVLILASACQLAGPAPGDRAGGREPAAPRDPIVEEGSISRSAEARAAELFRDAERALAAGDPAEALRLAEEVVADFPSAPVSGRALLLVAESASAAGEASRAVSAADHYLRLIGADDERAARVRLIQARALENDPAARVDRLLRFPSRATAEEKSEAVLLLGSAAAAIDEDARRALLVNAGGGSPLAWVLEVQVAVDAFRAGDTPEATRLAERALAGGAVGPDRAIAEGVLAGTLPGGPTAVTRLRVGTVLPLTGPPALADFAQQVAEGIEVAAAEFLGSGFEVDLLERDDQADPGQTAALAAELEREGVAGIVGFLEDEALLAAAQARSRGVPLVSPTARTADGAGPDVYSLEGADPEAARLMAEYARDRGYTRVAIVHSNAQTSAREADAFQEAVQGYGIPVVSRLSYEVGATFFEPQIVGARNALRRAEIAALNLGEEDTLRVEMLEPVALFLPIPAEDVEFVGPQISHFALDTLAVEILGTSAWTSQGVLSTVDPRHTRGVVATAAAGIGPSRPGSVRFREAYERHFRRTLVSAVPQIGWDAAMLILEAARAGGQSPAGVRSALTRLELLEGVTGHFSVHDGVVVRDKEVVQIDNNLLVPIG